MESKNNNPLDHAMILKLVLENVGRANVADLKNCRLVNHSWNKIAVEVLEQQHGYALELNYGKILDFKSLLWNTQLSRMNSEFKQLTSLRVSLTLYPLNSNANFGEVGQLLTIHPHLRVALINFKYFASEENKLHLVNHELCNFFKLASTNLTNITIWNISFTNLTPTHFEEFDFGCFGSVEFPKLTSVRYCRSSKADAENSVIVMPADLTNHMVSIIQKAPNLTKLIVSVNEGSAERSAYSFGLILQDCATHLEELDIREEGVDEEALLKVLAKIKFPSLKTLKLRRGIPYFTNEFSQFLANNCPNLTSIYMEWYSTPEDEDLRTELLYSCPNIIYIGLYPATPFISKPEHWEYLRMIFAHGLTMFPSLQSLGTSLDILLMLGANLKISDQLVPSRDQYPILSNISSLDLQINSTSRELLGVLDMTSRIYQHTFPNLKKLIIKSDLTKISRLFECGLYPIAPTAIIEFLCSHAGLQYLEIHSSGVGLLEKLTSNNENHILAGLKSLKLVALAVDSSVEIIKLVSRLPSLEYLQVGKEIVSRAEIQTIRNVISRLGKLSN